MSVLLGAPDNHSLLFGGVEVLSFTPLVRGFFHGGREIDELSFTLVNAVSSVVAVSDLSIGTTVQFFRGIGSTVNAVFEGEVVNVTNLGPGGWFVECKDRMWRAAKHVFSNDYVSTDQFGGDPSLIWRDHMLRSGVPLDDSFIVDPPVGVLLRRYPVDDERAYRSARRIVDEINYRMYYDAAVGSARFEPLRFVKSGITLEVGVNVTNRPEWRLMGDELIQKVIVRGAADVVKTSESFAVSGSVYVLQDIPVAISVSVDGAEQVHGINGIDDPSLFDYYVDLLSREVVFNDAPSGTTVLVEYDYLVERPVIQESSSSIASYATEDGVEYPYMDVLHLPDVSAVEDALRVADGALSDASSVEPGASLRVRGLFGLRPNMEVDVVDVESGIDRVAVVSRVEYQYPFVADLVTVHKRPLFDMDVLYSTTNRVKRLEEQLSKGRKVSIIVFGSDKRVGVGRRVFSIESRQVVDGFDGIILSHPVYGFFGRDLVDDPVADVFDSFELFWRVPANDVYEEFLFDEDYIDSSLTTGAVDVVDREVLLDDGDRFQTACLVKGKTYSEVTISANFSAPDDLVVLISSTSDFSSSQTVTLGVALTLSFDTADGFYVRCTSSADGNLLSNVVGDFGRVTRASLVVSFANG